MSLDIDYDGVQSIPQRYTLRVPNHIYKNDLASDVGLNESHLLAGYTRPMDNFLVAVSQCGMLRANSVMWTGWIETESIVANLP